MYCSGAFDVIICTHHTHIIWKSFWAPYSNMRSNIGSSQPWTFYPSLKSRQTEMYCLWHNVLRLDLLRGTVLFNRKIWLLNKWQWRCFPLQGKFSGKFNIVRPSQRYTVHSPSSFRVNYWTVSTYLLGKDIIYPKVYLSSL